MLSASESVYKGFGLKNQICGCGTLCCTAYTAA